ncbi:MAG: TlpA disulfide reductase family protein [Flavobacteriaceae bacterium]|jgi:thiol-disulfide isomerase/thioredoxin|nr:TlpA disulfide reductase family protein [Flavobacteriaceae bacterium]MDG2289635.1 TlpA disulfide reductase family protein [Flavobacteriaceae bacterium]
MLYPKFLLFLLFPLLLNAQTVPSLSYNELKPLLNQKGDKIYVVNFWATWCAPCIKELPYFEVLDQREDVEVLLVSLDFPKHKESRLLPFIKKNKLQAKVVLLDDADENYWINDIHPNWSGALPATLIYTKKQRGFYEQSFTASKLDKILKLFNP